mmetsp:Transcript_17359/g.37672  ORF Transcript_17359/g.37672 Transcript_17359/m.37672 type:complete len:261 (+) Transcript_17359:196-978(+)
MRLCVVVPVDLCGHAGGCSVRVAGMQEVVGHLPARLGQEVLVQFAHIGVFVGLADHRLLVDGVCGRCTMPQHLLVLVLGVARAADTAAIATHHLDKVVVSLALVDEREETLDAASRRRDGDVERGAPDVNGRFDGPWHLLHRRKVEVGHLLSLGGDLVRGAEGGDHHPPGVAEDDGGTRGETHGRVVGGFGEVTVGDFGHADHCTQLPCRENKVDILTTIAPRPGELRSLSLVLLGDTRHDRHHHHVLGRDTELARHVRL